MFLPLDAVLDGALFNPLAHDALGQVQLLRLRVDGGLSRLLHLSFPLS